MTVKTTVFWRVTYDAHGSAGYTSTPLMTAGAVGSFVTHRVEHHQATNVRITETTLTETSREVDPAELGLSPAPTP